MLTKAFKTCFVEQNEGLEDESTVASIPAIGLKQWLQCGVSGDDRQKKQPREEDIGAREVFEKREVPSHFSQFPDDASELRARFAREVRISASAACSDGLMIADSMANACSSLSGRDSMAVLPRRMALNYGPISNNAAGWATKPGTISCSRAAHFHKKSKNRLN